MDTQEVLALGSKYLYDMEGHIFDVLTVSKPISPEAAVNLSKIVSKLSPILGNLIEFNTVEFLNDQESFEGIGRWRRQDPGFPDAVFDGVTPTPGFEIKTWFPLATEITARFRDSQNHFKHDQTYVALLAWLPEYLIFGKPRIIDVCVVSGLSVAKARDNHYHNPPDYLVIEPEDTSDRTANLQQTNTSGYKFQGSAVEFRKAESVVASWGKDGRKYEPTPEYQARLRELVEGFKYRLDTNYSKMDRIVHPEIEEFKAAVHSLKFHGMTVGEWNQLLIKGSPDALKASLEKQLDIKEEDADELLV